MSSNQEHSPAAADNTADAMLGELMQAAMNAALLSLRRRGGTAVALAAMDEVEACTAELVVEVTITGAYTNISGHLRKPSGSLTVLDVQLVPPTAAARAH